MNHHSYKVILLTLSLFLSSFVLQAKIQLPSVLGDNMVLLQNSKVNIWGKATKNTKVIIIPSWSGKTYTTQSDKDGKWLINIDTPAAGGPFEISISDGEKLTLQNILIGEVWFCSGQSNMEMPMKGFGGQPIEGANKIIAKAKKETPIRIYTSKNEYSKVPQEDVVGEWSENTSEGVAKASATAYYFAQFLQETLDVPVGIIVSSWGGSKIEAWMSRDYFKEFPEFDLSFLDNDEKPNYANHQAPTHLYNAKVHPLKNYTVKGMIWYQGESNRDKSKQYFALQKAFVKNMREVWNHPEMPFYYVQIAPFKYDGSENAAAADLREAQLLAMKEIPNSGMVVTMDIGEENRIHPANKEDVGARLAYWALSQTYGKKGFGYSAPIYQSMKVDGDRIKLEFEKFGSNGFAPHGENLKHFEIAGEDKVFHPAIAWAGEGGIYVRADEVPNPVAVRYAYKNFVSADLKDELGLPVSSFRTDNWD